MKISWRIDRRDFDRTLAVYRRYSRRDPATIANTKAFYIARRASVETVRARPQAIRRFIGKKRGRIIGMLINKRRGLRGEKGLYGAAMMKEVEVVLAARLRSRAFLASG